MIECSMKLEMMASEAEVRDEVIKGETSLSGRA